jgi:hypothetical protein
MPLARPDPSDIGWWGDASTSFGIGIVIGSFWAVWKWAPGFKIGPNHLHDIGWAEAVAVELGLRLAIHLKLFHSSDHSARSFLAHSDNLGVVTVIRKGRSRSRETNLILKQIYRMLAQERITLIPSWVSTRQNIADALSRGDVADFLAQFPSSAHRVSIALPDHLADKLVSW